MAALKRPLEGKDRAEARPFPAHASIEVATLPRRRSGYMIVGRDPR